MTDIPEDSMLRRHYLTEVKFQQERNREKFMSQTIQKSVDIQSEPIWSKRVLIPAVMFLFFIAVIFI